MPGIENHADRAARHPDRAEEGACLRKATSDKTRDAFPTVAKECDMTAPGVTDTVWSIDALVMAALS